MARIPDDELERLKSEISLVRLVETKGVELRKHGPDLIGRCPFHDDRDPSFVVSAAKNLWCCHGACQVGGSVVDFVMRAEGVSFRHAVDLLREGVGVSDAAPVRRSTVAKLASIVEHDAEDRVLLERVVGFYAETLRESPDTLEFLARRRIDHSDAVERFRLGFANRTLGYRLPASNRREGGELRGRLQRLGIIRGSGHEHFNGSLVVPVINNSQVLEMYGRKINDHLRAGTPKHLYLPRPHRGVFNVEAFAAGDEIIVCESLIDALSLWCWGFRHVTAAYGTEGFGQDHFDAIDAHGIRRVLIAFDADDTGDKAAMKLAGRLLVRGVECFRVNLPRNADVNDVVIDAQHPTDALGRWLRKASWMGSGPTPPRRQLVAVVDEQRHAAKQKTPGHGEVPSFVASPPPAPAGGPVEPQVASPASEIPSPDVHVDERELVLRFGERRWRVRGLSKVTSFDLLRVNVLVGVGDRFHVDTLDLYSARARQAFCQTATAEVGVDEAILKRDLGRVLLSCEEHAEQVIAAAQAPKTVEVVLSDEDRVGALEFLQASDLVERIVADFAAVGLVGEATNCLVGYLAAISRKLDQPLAVIVQSTSAAGKSALMDAVVGFVPDEDRVRFSAMTGQSLFYMGEADLAHKVLAIAEEEGAERAAYALKLLQSEGELSIASTGKDTASGRLVTHTYEVKGPTAIVLTTTAIDVDEELLNRCIVLTVDEDRAQTRAIHDRQRRRHTLAGMLATSEREQVVKRHQDAQRLLGALPVVIPDAEQLTFADVSTRTRRDHVKYLTLIRAVALLHQHQRSRRTATAADGRTVTYIEADLSDIALANRLAHDVLGHSLDEVPPQTRRLLSLLDEHVHAEATRRKIDREQVRFTRRQLREHLGCGDTQLKVHLGRLVDLELVVAQRGEHTAVVYALAWTGQGNNGGRFLVGLTDPARITTTVDRSGPEPLRSGSGRGPVGGSSGGGRDTPNGANGQASADVSDTDMRDDAERADPAHSDRDVVVIHTAGAR